ncbi:hypothetical protein CEXT_340581 [Caerostris extrusa]|uniref:Uncharacterized protein n=1 Tax=Caerostris extrusa TaxID=172846 RepID=A0AAV4N0X1_CAEEX|nr:hypothetical protein CEXT_340581 [Caerostris extrusa]
MTNPVVTANNYDQLSGDETDAANVVMTVAPEPRLPPIMVRFNDGLKEHVAAISNQHKEDVRVKLAGEQLKIFPVNSDVHRAVTRYLTEKSWNFLLLHRKINAR